MNHARYQLPDTRYHSGFALIEMLVTTSIIAIVSSIVLFSFPTFASKIILENLTHEIALVVRQAQVYGIGIKRQAGTENVFPGYGAHFEVENPYVPEDAGSPNKRVVFFADANGNDTYDFVDGNGDGLPDPEEGETLEVFIIERGNYISDLCYATTGPFVCGGTTKIDITFKRPDPNASMTAYPSGGSLSSVRIVVSSPKGSTVGDRFIEVWASGQIAVTTPDEEL